MNWRQEVYAILLKCLDARETEEVSGKSGVKKNCSPIMMEEILFFKMVMTSRGENQGPRRRGSRARAVTRDWRRSGATMKGQAFNNNTDKLIPSGSRRKAEDMGIDFQRMNLLFFFFFFVFLFLLFLFFFWALPRHLEVSRVGVD